MMGYCAYDDRLWYKILDTANCGAITDNHTFLIGGEYLTLVIPT